VRGGSSVACWARWWWHRQGSSVCSFGVSGEGGGLFKRERQSSAALMDADGRVGLPKERPGGFPSFLGNTHSGEHARHGVPAWRRVGSARAMGLDFGWLAQAAEAARIDSSGVHANACNETRRGRSHKVCGVQGL
jgi:hypothetical protein